MIGLLVSLVIWPINFVIGIVKRFGHCIALLQYSVTLALVGLLGLVLHLLGLAGLVTAVVLVVESRMHSPAMLVSTPGGIRVLVIAGASVAALVAESLLGDHSMDKAVEEDYRQEVRMRSRVEAEEEDRRARMRRRSPQSRL